MRRQSHPYRPPVALTVAGSDSGGGAGIQADVKSMEAAGAFATSVLTAVTAQNTRGVSRSHVLPLEDIDAQFTAVLDDFAVKSLKTGMLATADVIELVTEHVEALEIPIVVDPVMVAASGDRLLDQEAESAYEPLIAASTVVTPNADEASVLTDEGVMDRSNARRAGEQLVAMGADAALVKGGHLEGDAVTDVLVRSDQSIDYEHPRVATRATHGSGCTLASTIAARLAHGDPLEAAIARALSVMERAVRYPIDVGKGPGSVHHLAALRDAAAKPETMASVRTIVDGLVERDVSALVPEVGMNVVGATPFAETVEDTAAVEGRITRTASGIRPNAGIAMGASSHVARFLLAVREYDPAVRFAINCRLDGAVEQALSELDWTLTTYDRDEEPADVRARDGATMAWAARMALTELDETPAAVLDHGAHGKEPIVKLLARDRHTLLERTLALHDRLVD